ncbi:LysR family transcriptional regulator [Xanthomonas arboricola]|uniref:LysR family transcriptional regulator n=1 Tax=Xanthomonas arboricola TaxID=56448 RepID=UPI00061A153A|nr:LysR family transcriptional regulator [Xanthomonas arboricola]AKC80646.1 LysR family transcriptional regulator [Xanthomonas arboricola]
MNNHLRDMALFVEVVKAKGFRNAADSIGIPNSTLSRRITELEKSIGLRLLHRTTRKLELTEAGLIYFDRAKRIVEEARLAHEQLGDMLAQPTGVLRVSFPVDFAVIYLAPLIAEFAALYPGITFDFDLTPRRVDLVSEPFDVAIRVGESADSHLIARTITTLHPSLFASPQYLQQHGVPDSPEALQRHECFSVSRQGNWTLKRGAESIEIAATSRFNVNSVGMIRRLATLGMGIVLMPREIVADDLERGALEHVMPNWHGTPLSVYAITETRLLPAKTQRFVDFLKARLGKEPHTP